MSQHSLVINQLEQLAHVFICYRGCDLGFQLSRKLRNLHVLSALSVRCVDLVDSAIPAEVQTLECAINPSQYVPLYHWLHYVRRASRI